MYSIPDHSAELRRLQRIAWWEMTGITAAVLSIIGLALSVLYETPGNPSLLTSILMFGVVPVALIFYAITNARTGLSTDIQLLTRYEEFRRLYDTFRRTPSIKNGEQLYSHYHSFRSRHTKEDKVMAEALQRCMPNLIKIGVIRK